MNLTSLKDILQSAGQTQQNLVTSLFNTSTSTSTTATDPMTTILQGEEQLMSLSALGTVANTAYKAAQASGDANVTAGVQQAMNTLLTQNMTPDSLTTLQTINTLARDDQTTFNSVFSTVNTLNTQGMTTAVTPFLNAVNAAYTQSGSDGVTSLISDVTQTLNSGGTDTATTLKTLTAQLQQYLPTSTAVAKANTGDTSATVILAEDPNYLRLDYGA